MTWKSKDLAIHLEQQANCSTYTYKIQAQNVPQEGDGKWFADNGLLAGCWPRPVSCPFQQIWNLSGITDTTLF